MNQQLIPQLHLDIVNPYIAYMYALILSFFLGFYIIIKNYQGNPGQKIRYSITAGLLATKFVIAIASLLGIDHVFLYLRIGVLRIPISSNLLLFISSLMATISLNWEKINKHLTITEKEYQQIVELT
ncbi:MAG: hypothetical protein J7L82_02450 [Staphylothermus sp.]|nr:hypothetical protein [Staphylothermus sp.]